MKHMLLITAAILPLLSTNTNAQAKDPHGWIGTETVQTRYKGEGWQIFVVTTGLPGQATCRLFHRKVSYVRRLVWSAWLPR